MLSSRGVCRKGALRAAWPACAAATPAPCRAQSHTTAFTSCSNITNTSVAARTMAVSSLQCPKRFLRTTNVARMHVELDPSSSNYAMELAFEEPTFRYLCEGYDVDWKNEIRAALTPLLPPKASNFTQRQAAASSVQQTLQLFRALGKQQLVSYAQVRSTPHRLASYYEVLATAHPALALLAADHFTFAGMIATHAHADLQKRILDHVDSGKVIGCLAQRELLAEEAPLNTEARYDFHDKCFILRGTGKFAVAAAECADWALVTATLTLNKMENSGAHVFAVPLRENGVLCSGVTVRPIAGEDSVLSQSGAAVIHFDNVRLGPSHLLAPFVMTAENTVGYIPGRENEKSALEVLRTRTRVATGALYAGAMKTLCTNVVRYTANKMVLGPDYRRNYPYFGLQHVQTPLVSLVAKAYAYLMAWQRVLPVFCDVSGKAEPSYEDEMRLAGTVHCLQEEIMELHRFADEFMGVHGSLASSGSRASAALVHLRQEGPDRSALIREVAFRSITKNIGTSHWGWWATNVVQSLPAVNRFIKNPWYSPRIADLGRHLIFFNHKHYEVKKRLRQSREMERRKGGSEHQWYDWVMFRHREVVHCGEAFMEIYLLEVLMDETQKCTDARGRKIIRDIGWIYALTRQMDRLDYILAKKMLSANKAVVLASHLDNIVTVLAPQCVNLVEAMEVPVAFRAPCAAEDMEPYWTIPGTNTHIERGDKVTLHEDKEWKKRENTKAGQEEIREETDEFDLFHGMADKPSYVKSTKK